MEINQPSQQSLPLKIEVHEENLLQAKNEIQKFIKVSEGMVFGKLGLSLIMLGTLEAVSLAVQQAKPTYMDKEFLQPTVCGGLRFCSRTLIECRVST